MVFLIICKKEEHVQALSSRFGIEGSLVHDTPGALRCVLEENTLYSAYWKRPNMTICIFDYDIKQQNCPTAYPLCTVKELCLFNTSKILDS